MPLFFKALPPNKPRLDDLSLGNQHAGMSWQSSPHTVCKQQHPSSTSPLDVCNLSVEDAAWLSALGWLAHVAPNRGLGSLTRGKLLKQDFKTSNSGPPPK